MFFLATAFVLIAHRATCDEQVLWHSSGTGAELTGGPSEPAKSRCLIQRGNARWDLQAVRPLLDVPDVESAPRKHASTLLLEFVRGQESNFALLADTPLWLRTSAGGMFFGAVGGLLLVPVMPYAAVTVIASSAAMGGAIGGSMGMLAEAGYLPMDELLKDIGMRVANITLIDAPLMDKLSHLAMEIIAVDKYEAANAKTYEESQGYKKDQKEAEAALERIVKAHKQWMSGNDPIAKESTRKEVESDFQILEEVMSHGETAMFVSAESSVENQAVLTENDVALLEGKRGEDVGLKNGSKLLTSQGDMITAKDFQKKMWKYYKYYKMRKKARAAKKKKEEEAKEAAEAQLYNGTLYNFMKNADEDKKSEIATLQTAAEANRTRISAGIPWTNGKIKYCYAPEVSEHAKHLFEAATKWYENAIPCLDFEDVGLLSGTSTSPEWQQRCKKSPAVFVQNNAEQGCYAYVGMVASMPSQRVQIREPACLSIGTILHEIGHALGMGHEQSRSDRDDHVLIHWQNIHEGKEHNFAIIEGSYDDAEYDALSIMHYDNYAFTKQSSQPTIEYIGQGTHDTLGQRSGLSAHDVAQLGHMYVYENPECEANQLDGEGCIDSTDHNGNDMCSGINQCSSTTVEKCCACGGGTKVQCYKNQECPRTELLPVEDYSSCIKDLTHLYKAAAPHIPCIYQNLCDFDVGFKCSNLQCSHVATSKRASAASCGADYQTKICTAVQDCQLWKN